MSRASGRVFALCALACMSLFGATILLARSLGFRINESASLPLGIWRISQPSGPLRAGAIVSVCPPDTPVFQDARRRGYVGWGSCEGGYEPLLKLIAAMEGDNVRVTADGIQVNGHAMANSKARTADFAGRELPQAIGGIVPEGMVWVLSCYNAQSFDSRYFGSVPAANVLGAAKPILTFGDPE